MDNYKKLLQHLILLSILIATILFPQQKAHGLDVLECLGAEELILHKKKLTGPLYTLNQRFINELSSWGKIHIKPKELTKICTSQEFSPSVNLLRHFIIFEKSFFEVSTYKKTISEIALQKSLINSLMSKIPNIFFNYLSSLQALAENPKCLNLKVPELNYFIYQFKYLEDEIPTKFLLKNKSKLSSIFNKIRDLDVILKSCSEISKLN
jgi:hypothetical protein